MVTQSRSAPVPAVRDGMGVVGVGRQITRAVGRWGGGGDDGGWANTQLRAKEVPKEGVPSTPKYYKLFMVITNDNAMVEKASRALKRTS